MRVCWWWVVGDGCGCFISQRGAGAAWYLRLLLCHRCSVKVIPRSEGAVAHGEPSRPLLGNHDVRLLITLHLLFNEAKDLVDRTRAWRGRGGGGVEVGSEGVGCDREGSWSQLGEVGR